MRRRIELYIAGRLADLSDDSFILWNWTQEDLSNPTVVKNSFSQQITLKGTENNNAIFGDAFRLDRQFSNTGGVSGPDFLASRKTPFTIYADTGEILQSGYLKLDSVTRKGAAVEYKVTLYGGLGSFFYALSYDDGGNKRTLADLNYLGTSAPESELDFTINAQSVQAAWTRLYNSSSVEQKWDVINFAPAYQGIPENFSADKALVQPSAVGLAGTIGNYTTKNGYALVSLASEMDEWAVKDFRSYLQRPVFSMRAFLEAICSPANNGGYEVDITDVEDIMTMNYNGLWMTLPTLPSLGTYKQSSGSASVTFSQQTSGLAVARYDIATSGGDLPSGTKITANVGCVLSFVFPSAASGLTLTTRRDVPSLSHSSSSMFTLQAIAYSSEGTEIARSNVKLFGDDMGSGWRPATGGYDIDILSGTITKTGALQYAYSEEIGFTVEGTDISYIVLSFNSYVLDILYGRQSVNAQGRAFSMYSQSSSYTATSIPAQNGTNNQIIYTSSENLRSNARITKKMLLSTEYTPCEYLLSLCKIFGLSLLYDNAERKVTIVTRNSLYQDETVDLSGRVDTSQPISINPMAFDAKWYQFALESVGGRFADEYKAVGGVDYGIRRVNTGYDFNADTTELLSGNAFKSAVTILDKSRYYNTIKVGGAFRPSVFVDKGNKYTLWNSAGNTLETGISCPPSTASITYLNEYGHEGYDIETARKLDLRDAEGKPIDGAGILVFCEGWNTYDYFKLTDDIAEMDLLNEGSPCWLLGPGSADGQRIPIFQTYLWSNWNVSDSLDFGVPKEMDIPSVTSYPESATIYGKCWQNYIRDRYDADTKVMTCKVDWKGIPVTQDLLRKFYWYGGSIWSLNAIRNYSLTTQDPVECEFVQVQDTDNYTGGQDL